VDVKNDDVEKWWKKVVEFTKKVSKECQFQMNADEMRGTATDETAKFDQIFCDLMEG
jgi:hypothetical protein